MSSEHQEVRAMLGILADSLSLLDSNIGSGGSSSSGGSSGSSSSGGGASNSGSGSGSSVKRLPGKPLMTGHHSPPVLDAQAVANILLGTSTSTSVSVSVSVSLCAMCLCVVCLL